MTKDERIRQLEDEVTVLKDALGLNYKANPEWGISGPQAQLLGVMAATAVATNERLRLAIWGLQEEPPSGDVVKVQICKMRPKLEKYGIVIKNKWGVGYYLTPESRAIVKAAA